MNFWEIHDQYHERVRRFILSLVKDEWVADDLIQDTFVRIQENLESVRDSSRISSWIFRIAYNLCKDYFRQSRKTSFKEIEGEGKREIYQEASIQKELEQQQMGLCVQDQVSLLPESLRSVIVLYDVMGFNHSEVAEILGIRTENAKVRLHRARKKLKTILEEKCAFEMDERDVLVCEPVDK